MQLQRVLTVNASGLYRVEDSNVSAIAVVSTLNPQQLNDLRAAEKVLTPII